MSRNLIGICLLLLIVACYPLRAHSGHWEVIAEGSVNLAYLEGKEERVHIACGTDESFLLIVPPAHLKLKRPKVRPTFSYVVDGKTKSIVLHVEVCGEETLICIERSNGEVASFGKTEKGRSFALDMARATSLKLVAEGMPLALRVDTKVFADYVERCTAWK